jgi:uncharacterized protein YkwD
MSEKKIIIVCKSNIINLSSMRFYTSCLIVFLFFTHTFSAQESALKEALDYLNLVRANPSMFSKEVGVSLKGVEKRPELQWNETLAKAAQTKAEDMAKNNYFGHVDKKGYGMNFYINKAGYKLSEVWLKNPKENYFESISAGSDSPREGIVDLINDGNVVDHQKAGHRLHLLGISDFHTKSLDIGIGWATNPNSPYKTYLVVLIARHDW